MTAPDEHAGVAGLVKRLRNIDYFGQSRAEQDAIDALCKEAADELERRSAFADPAALERLTRVAMAANETCDAYADQVDRLTASLSAALAANQAMVTAGTFADGLDAAAKYVVEEGKRSSVQDAIYIANAIAGGIQRLAPPPAAAKGDAL